MPDDLPLLGDFFAPWRDFANCIDTREQSWFPFEIEDENERARSIEEAKRICSGCSVRIECLDDDMAYGYKESVRAGLDEAGKIKLNRHRVRYNQYFWADVKPALERVKLLSADVKLKLAKA